MLRPSRTEGTHLPVVDAIELGAVHFARKINQTTKTYSNEWIVVQEALQNALDAIYGSGRTEGHIEIVMNVNDDSVSVRDDGKGFPHDVTLLGYGGSDKNSSDPNISKYGGSQGVGLKVIYYSSQEFSLRSVTRHKLWWARIENGCRYLEEPVKIEYSDPAETAGPDDRPGTVVAYRFPRTTRPGRVHQFLNMLADTYHHSIQDAILGLNTSWLDLALEVYFRTESYAANVSRLLGLPIEKVAVSLKVVCDLANYPLKGELREEVLQLLRQASTVEAQFPNMYWDIKEAVRRTRPGLIRPTIIDEEIQPSGRGNPHNPSYIWQQSLRNPDEYERLVSADYALQEPVELQRYRNGLFPHLLGIHMVVGSTEDDRLPRYLVGRSNRFIAARGVPTSHSIQTPAGVGELGYVPYVQFIADVDQELNEGKRTFSNPYLVGLINDFFRDAYRVTLRNIVIRITGRTRRAGRSGRRQRPPIPETNVVDRAPLPVADMVSIKKVPVDEESVIALFYEMIGRGFIRGIETYANFRTGKYDARGVVTSPLDAVPRVVQRDEDLDVIEFKRTLSGIIDDIESEDKDPEEMDLLIVWEDDLSGTENSEYQVISVDHSEFHDRPYHRVKKCLRVQSYPAEVQVLVLREVLVELSTERATTGSR